MNTPTQRAHNLQIIADQKDEIERLKQYACQCEASVHSTQEGYADLQAEIDWLKEENTLLRRDCAQLSELNQDRLKLKELSEQSAFWANHENAKLKQLIGELAAALEEDEDLVEAYCSSKWCKEKFKPLLERAREAIK